MAARHLATTHNFALVEMSLSTVMRSDVGGSEKQIRNIFSEAKARSPSLLLIDEFEAMFGSNDEGNSSSQSTLVSTLISCLDDITEWNQAGGTEAHVFVVATSRSPSDIDSRFLQVGRLSSGIFFGPLAVEESKAFLDVILQSLNLGFEVDSDEVHNLVKKTKAWTGSDFHLLHKRVLFDLAEKRVASPKELVSVLEGHIYAQLPTCRQEDVDEILSWTTQHRSFVVANLPKQSSD